MSTINVLGPVGYNPTGTYDPTRAYEKLDVVYYQGSSYVATNDSIGQLPTNTEYWDCIAAGSLKQFVYDTVADMKADNTLSEGMIAQTLGYYSIEDNGSARYIIKQQEAGETIDNGRYIPLNNGLIAKLVIENATINVKQLGAYGDGTHDDYDVFQSVINYCITNKYKLYADKSVYLISTGLVINNYINLKIDGTLKTTSNISLLTLTCDNSIININNLLGTNNTGKGLVLNNKNYNNTLNINTIIGFGYGIAFLANSNGIQYTKTNFQLLNNTYNIYYKADGSSWINQNMFTGGKLSGTYGVYFAEGTNQANRYDGNNFYNIGFEELDYGIVLYHASLNAFHDFRMLENITNECITLSNNCSGNLFESRETSLALWNKISDACNVYQRRNIYNMTVQLSDYTIGVEELTILNNLPFIRKYRYNTNTNGNRQYLANDASYNTSSEPFRKINLFTADLTGTAHTITVNLDERYNYLEEDYNEFYVKINARDGDKNLIIKTSDNTEIFNLSTITGTIGSYSGVFKITHITNTGGTKWVINKIST